MKSHLFFLMSLLLMLTACVENGENEQRGAARESEGAQSLYDEDRGLKIPDEMRASLGLQVAKIDATSNPLKVPVGAVIDGVEHDFVYVEKDGYFVQSKVVLGPTHNGAAQILEGLNPDDRVVVEGARDLRMIELLAVRGGSACCGPAKDDEP